MFGVIGLGQAGCNIADLFAENGYPSLAINFSQRDLDSLEYIEEKLKLVGSEGVGKNRDSAIELMSKNWETVATFVKNNFSQPSIQMIMIVFSTGGGSGSGIAPLITELLLNEFEDKVVVCCPILPSLDESTTAQLNTLSCLKEISELDVCILPVDNGTDTDSVSKSRLYSRINNEFVKLMISVTEHTELHSKHGNLDQKDLLSLFNQRGFAIVSHTDIANISHAIHLGKEDSVVKLINESWIESIFTPVNYEKIVKIGIIFNGQEELMSLIDVKSICHMFRNEPMDVFEGWYCERKGDVYTILTGLQFNQHRLDELESCTIQQTEVLSDVLTQSHSLKLKSSNIQLKPIQKKKKPLSDIIKKYQK